MNIFLQLTHMAMCKEMTKKAVLMAMVAVLISGTVQAQRKVVSQKKYPSLFWEISGKGMKKPSYLFGTMHVSSKMVFHLSDSFYHAMRNSDAVALELNPEDWQRQMFGMQKAQIALANFTAQNLADYLNEKSFQLTPFEDKIKRALNEEPTAVNSLLYRSYQSRADFEENTYLDLYIYQTGRKLGKTPAGVENYLETEKIMMEAYQDMEKEKTKRQVDTDGESLYEIQKKIQDAYRQGDLDLMDSLDNITTESPAFNEKFLYLRNEIQASSIDTILQKRSLFVGVGAAHLPGKRGVIELLRKKGYTMRPIFMQDRDATQKESIDKLRVPVTFRKVETDDKMIQLQLPGQLYKREEAKGNQSWQYADMDNGAYYMVTRVRTHAAMLGNSEARLLQKIDSMLYENIPGKILKRVAITKNGYNGFDITNRTRRGDIQRYNILVSPFEVLVFKMSGPDTYVEGKEAEQFFNSINIKSNPENGWVTYAPAHGGFSIMFPQQPNVALIKNDVDRLDKWEYEAIDKLTGSSFMLWKKSISNFSFIEEDTFDLALMDESFSKSEFIEKQLKRKLGKQAGIAFSECKYLAKDGNYFTTKSFVKGSHYYMLAATSRNNKESFSTFFNSFKFTDFVYPAARKYEDTILQIVVQTPVVPNIDTSLRIMMEKATSDEFLNATRTFYNYWPKTKGAIFKSDSTGEAIAVNIETFPKYYYSRDSAKFWRDRIEDRSIQKDMRLASRQFVSINDSVAGYRLVYTDTNSSRSILTTYLLKENKLYKFATLTDTMQQQSAFISGFFSSFTPYANRTGPSVFENKINVFFADYNSKDSIDRKRATTAIPNIYFTKNEVNRMAEAIAALKFGDKEYFDTKTKFITELGYIKDTCCTIEVINLLKNLYAKSGDTSLFHNVILTALARLQTNQSFALLKQVLLQDPPVFDNSYEYNTIFNQLSDTLSLAKNLYPDLLQLASVEDYKPGINNLLAQLVDSGYVGAKDYADYFTKLHFEAKILLKKQQNKEEKRMQQESKGDEETGISRGYGTTSWSAPVGNNSLMQYAVLLLPFYDTQPAVPDFFNKILQTRDLNLRLQAAILLIRKNKTISDTILQNLAASDEYRAKLLAKLQWINRASLFPLKYKTQEAIARSLLLNDKNLKKFEAIEYIGKRPAQVKDVKGNVYLFRYKVTRQDEWKFGLSGLQPANLHEVNTNNDLVRATDRKIQTGAALEEQFQIQAKRLIFEMHKSARNFFSDNRGSFYNRSYQDLDEEEE